MFVNNINAILLITFCLIIFQIKYIKKFNLEINKLKNNEKFTETEEDKQIREIVINTVDQVYNMDTEAIRNLGAISKSILTGKNYHNLSESVTPGKLVIPANVEIKGSLNITANTGIQGSLNLLQPGSIIMWSTRNIPDGWTICDGNGEYIDANGSTVAVPNLSGRFILGAGVPDRGNNTELDGPGGVDDVDGTGYTNEDYGVGDTSGQKKVTLTERQMPGHTHPGIQKITQTTVNWNGIPQHPMGIHQPDVYGHSLFQHSPVNSQSTGNNESHNNMPPYYVLYYIIKL